MSINQTTICIYLGPTKSWEYWLPIATNCRILVKIYGGTTDWHVNWRLLQNCDLKVISVNPHFTSIYFYLTTHVYATDTPVYWHFMSLLSSVYFQCTGLLLMCNTVLQGANVHDYGPYILSEYHADLVTYIIWDNPVYIGHTLLRDLPITFDYWVPSTQSCSEAMEYLIVVLLAWAYDM